MKVTVAEVSRAIAKQLGLTSSTWGPFTQLIRSASTAILQRRRRDSRAASRSQFVEHRVGDLTGVRALWRDACPGGADRFGRFGETATFVVGGQFPIPGPPTTCPGTTSTSAVCSGGAIYQSYGISLVFVPIVLSEGRILLHLSTEVTDIDNTKTVFIQGVPTPAC